MLEGNIIPISNSALQPKLKGFLAKVKASIRHNLIENLKNS